MRKFLLLPLLLAVTAGCRGNDDTVRLNGTGASFPDTIYQAWFQTYSKEHPKVKINYQASGSGPGITALTKGTVDFAASDSAMKPEQIKEVARGAVCLPITAGAIVLAYNLEGVPNLKLSRKAYAGIFNGTVKKWDDAEIKATNPDAKLPSTEIAVVVRADASGTTDVFTKHLAAISPEFKEKPGSSQDPAWVVKTTKQSKNAGVTSSLNSTPGSIGYIEFGYLKTGDKLKQAALENKEGEFVTATTESSKATLDQTTLPDDLIIWNSDPSGKASYPIVTYTWLLCFEKYSAKEKGKMDALKDIVKYCLHEGQKSSAELGYVPLPESAISKVEKALDRLKLDSAAALRMPTNFASIQAR
jgi:phosphate transport system substrate-binding protein